MSYNKSYYESLNYSDYLDRQRRYTQLADETSRLLDSLFLLDTPILDYGCAVGFLANSLNNAGLETYGYDTSEWAIYQAKDKIGILASTTLRRKDYKVGYFLDVLEHIPEQDLAPIFNDLKLPVILVRIPVCKANGGPYLLEVSERDKTHIVRWTKDTWLDFFTKIGYTVMPLNLYSLYDSDGVFSFLGVRNV